MIPAFVLTAEPSYENHREFRRKFRQEPKILSPVEGTLQVRAGYFRFTSHSARKIYGNGAPDIELEGSIKVHSKVSFLEQSKFCLEKRRLHRICRHHAP